VCNQHLAACAFNKHPICILQTELCKAIAGFLFDTESAIIRVDMSEYMERQVHQSCKTWPINTCFLPCSDLLFLALSVPHLVGDCYAYVYDVYHANLCPTVRLCGV
jgi:hypothetical protein